MMTSLVLAFRHCIPPGEEQGHIKALIEDALAQFNGLYEKVEMEWEDEQLVFDYAISLANRERGRAVLESMGIALPNIPLPRVLPKAIAVQGTLYVLSRQRVRIEVEHTEVGGFVGRVLKPFVRTAVGKLIERMAAKRGLQITAE